MQVIDMENTLCIAKDLLGDTHEYRKAARSCLQEFINFSQLY